MGFSPVSDGTELSISELRCTASVVPAGAIAELTQDELRVCVIGHGFTENVSSNSKRSQALSVGAF
jgi:hypothetical protein